MKIRPIYLCFAMVFAFSSSANDEFDVNKNDKVYKSLNSSQETQLLTENENFESKMIKAVISDAFVQYNMQNKKDTYDYGEEQNKIPFAESFSHANYLGVVELEEFKPYKYTIKKAILYWEQIKPNQKNKLRGQIDINEFYRENLDLPANEKCPLCIAVRGVYVIVAGCIAITALCNSRCSNCLHGGICNSSCFTNSCSVTCNPDPNGGDDAIFSPWSSFNDWILMTEGPFIIQP